MHLSKRIVPRFVCLILGSMLSSGCQKDDDPVQDAVPPSDLLLPRALSTATFAWAQGPALDKYDFSNIRLQSKTAPVTGFYLQGQQDKRWLFTIKGEDTSLPTREHSLFELQFGWTPLLSWQWFGTHPANYLTFRLYKPDMDWWDQYCFAAQASSNTFPIMQGTDQGGRYLDVVAGPASMGKPSNGDCDSTSPMQPSGMLTVTVRYRCNDVDNHFQGFPDWAEWVCQ